MPSIFSCPGCGLNELHKSCPAHGTSAYMNPKHPAWGSIEGIILLRIAAGAKAGQDENLAALRAENERLAKDNIELRERYDKVLEKLLIEREGT
jgi:hypothetical protein